MKLICKKYKNRKEIPSKILKQLWMLNFTNTNLGSALFSILSSIDKTKIAYIVDDKGKVLSWGAVDNREIHIYTRKSYRRNSLGSKVFNALMVGENIKNISIYPHDRGSLAFYKKLKKIGKPMTFCQCVNCVIERDEDENY